MGVAQMEILMESIAHSGDLGTPNAPASEATAAIGEETVADSAQSLAGSSEDRRFEEGIEEVPAPASVPQPDRALEQLLQPLLREALRFRQNTSGSMTVIVCLEDGAELLVHFAQRDGGVDAIARCEPCDAPRLGGLWPRLQEALARRRIRLAPLRSVASQRPPSPSTQHISLDTELRRNRNQLPLNRPGWETWA